jgi:hypothetical protein
MKRKLKKQIDKAMRRISTPCSDCDYKNNCAYDNNYNICYINRWNNGRPISEEDIEPEEGWHLPLGGA